MAERIAAPVGQLSYLAVAVQLYAEPRIVRTVPAAAFYPRPRVESAVLRLDVRPQPAVAAPAPEAYLRLVQAGFKQPRKQLRNSLAEGLARRPAEAEALLRRARIDPARRAQTLSLDEWAELYAALSEECRALSRGRTSAASGVLRTPLRTADKRRAPGNDGASSDD